MQYHNIIGFELSRFQDDGQSSIEGGLYACAKYVFYGSGGRIETFDSPERVSEKPNALLQISEFGKIYD
jgi:hypothetical protein